MGFISQEVAPFLLLQEGYDITDENEFVRMKPAILLGAGSSLPAEYPSTQCLTNLVLSGKGVKRHSDLTYYIDGTTPPTGVVRLANCMVRRLHAEAERYFSARNKRPANYEDLFYLAKQVHDDAMGQMENPAVYPFITKLRAEMSPLVEAENAENEDPNKTSYPNIPDEFDKLLAETCNYISDIVWRSLCCKPTSTNHLKILVDACRTGNVTGIATLCHDTHVETHLRTKGIVLADGFSDEETVGRYWNRDLSSNSKTPFLKLHGSVDWFRFRPDDSPLCDEDSPWFYERIGISLKGDKVDGRPLLLIGTFNKVPEYSQRIFLDLHHRFRFTLREADQLVVCGYGFGDQGINRAILEWYYAKLGRRLLIIHREPCELFSNARLAIQIAWQVWKQRNSIDFMPSRLEEVDVDEFLRIICSPGNCSIHR